MIPAERVLAPMTPLSPPRTSQPTEPDYQDDFDHPDPHKSPEKNPSHQHDKDKDKEKQKDSDKRTTWRASAAMTRASFMKDPDAIPNHDFLSSGRSSGGNSPARSKNPSMEKSPLGTSSNPLSSTPLGDLTSYGILFTCFSYSPISTFVPLDLFDLILLLMDGHCFDWLFWLCGLPVVDETTPATTMSDELMALASSALLVDHLTNKPTNNNPVTGEDGAATGEYSVRNTTTITNTTNVLCLLGTCFDRSLAETR